MLNIGVGMGILITCESNPWHPWMSYSLWKSLTVYLPMAKIAVLAPPEYEVAYGWVKYFKIPLFFSENEKTKIFFSDLEVLKLPPHVVAVREYYAPIGPEDVRTNEIVTFVDFQNGCGTSTPADYRTSPPFAGAVKRWGKYNLSVNERKVLEHWQSINNGYLL